MLMLKLLMVPLASTVSASDLSHSFWRIVCCPSNTLFYVRPSSFLRTVCLEYSPLSLSLINFYFSNPSLNISLRFLILYLCRGEHAHRGQLEGVDSFLSPCRSWESNSGCQAWGQGRFYSLRPLSYPSFKIFMLVPPAEGVTFLGHQP